MARRRPSSPRAAPIAGAVLCALALLYGLRRSELLALRWDDVDIASSTVRVDEGLVKVHGGFAWTEGKSPRSRRTLPLSTR